MIRSESGFFPSIRIRLFAPLVGVVLAAPITARAQEAPPDEWRFSSELTSVLSMGNAEALTLGLGTNLEHRDGGNLLKLEAGGMRTESVLVTRRAVGTPGNFEIEETEEREKTAEAYFARARYDRSLGENFFTYGGIDWMRNTFAGIDSRLVLALGGGNTWTDNNASRFKTSYAATFTFQSDVVEAPSRDSNFPGARVGWEYWRQLTTTTEFESRLVGDLNLNDTEDVRADFTNSLAVAISDALALKPSLQILWQNLPSLTEIPLYTVEGDPLGDSVTAPLEKMDMWFRMALVLKI